MSHKKGQGTSRNGRDSNPQNMGVKKFGGEKVISGNILIRQRGTRFRAGEGVMMGRDYTLFAVREGVVQWDKRNRRVHVLAPQTAAVAS